jgi:hypothetical protein
MSDDTPSQDPMEFLKNFWANIGVPLPGMVAPTVDTDELGRRITDLKAVEGWLKSNLAMLQMTIQGLEMQRATISALQAMTQKTAEGEPAVTPAMNPFANPALWSWGFAQPATTADDPSPDTEVPAAAPEKSAPKRKPKR